MTDTEILEWIEHKTPSIELIWHSQRGPRTSWQVWTEGCRYEADTLREAVTKAMQAKH